MDLPAGLEIVVAAAPPLVRYPLMGCIDDRGRLFIGDAAGVNLDKKGLEEQLPNRVLLLEDPDGDGIYDKSTVFADRMTFPSGGCWVDGALFVASPPGIWRLADTDGDGMADQREMIVGGFDGWTGNGTHVHGPILHPTNGRLFWCTGQRGRIVQKDGTLVRDGRATGVWSAERDGSRIEWHSLGIMDNPAEIDFTADGQIVGTVNLQLHQPRGDTLVQWLFGGVYESPDTRFRSSSHADLPHTLERMPILHNFGHVAVCGFTRYRSGALNPAWKDDLFVTFFNTQKVVRTRLTSTGATYGATEHEFFKLNDPDAHFTDVIEDGDGSLLVLNTGGWVIRGCPSSLSPKPDLRGAIYRIRKRGHVVQPDPYGREIAWATLPPAELARLRTDDRWMVRERALRLTANLRPTAARPALLDAREPHAQLHACETIAHAKRLEPGQRDALLALLGQLLDPALEHAAMFAAIATEGFDLGTLRAAASPTLVRRLMVINEQTARDAAAQDALLERAKEHFDAADADLAATAVAIAARHSRVLERCYDELKLRLGAPQVGRGTLNLLAQVTEAHLAKPAAQTLVTATLRHRVAALQRTAWRVLAGQPGNVCSPEWLEPLDTALAQALGPGAGGDLSLLLDAIAKLQSNHFDATLRRIVDDPRRAQPTRLKALAAVSRPNQPLGNDAFALLLEILSKGSSPAARVDAARLLARVRLSKAQLLDVAPVLATAEPVELLQLLRPMQKKLDAVAARAWAEKLVRSPYFGSLEESVVKSSFQALSADGYESVLGPAVRAAAAANDAKKRRLELLAADATKGRAAAGRAVFEASSCAACHKVGDLGRAMGPDLTQIGRIRQPRDLLEAIVFPSASLARGYETGVIETSDGATMGVIKSESAEGLLVVDAAGQEKTIPHADIVGQTPLSTSLMPAGLEQAFTEQQLLDLVA
ncbi:MAG: c-type cytochrome, partial [Verrucomicrobia bacterium]|nr:c-type cytochrome [Verrucomicrobiota bacterium]